MTFKLIVKEEAAQETIEAYLWYEHKNKGLGEVFFTELDICYNKILKNPAAFQKQYKNFRQVLLKRFPYVVVFEAEEKYIIIYKVFHTSRNPRLKFRASKIRG